MFRNRFNIKIIPPALNYTVIVKYKIGLFWRNLESSNQDVPKDLMELALQSSWFKNSRYTKGKGKGVGGTGLGFRERPAIGYDAAASSQVEKIIFMQSFVYNYWKWNFQFHMTLSGRLLIG